MNLYLYIPPGSAHPGKMLRSLIFGLLYDFWLQNTHLGDFYAMAIILARRLMSHGYSFPNPEASLRRSLRQTPSPAQPTTLDTPPTARPK
jgi:hypothetical protein